MKLEVSPNHRFLRYADGRPFFYLADTAWELFHRCTREEVDSVSSLKGDDGHPVIKHCYSSPTTHCDVWLYEVVGGVHSWHQDDIDTGEEVWRFFSRYMQ